MDLDNDASLNKTQWQVRKLTRLVNKAHDINMIFWDTASASA